MSRYHFQVYWRYMKLWLYWEWRDIIFAIIEARTVRKYIRPWEEDMGFYRICGRLSFAQAVLTTWACQISQGFGKFQTPNPSRGEESRSIPPQSPRKSHVKVQLSIRLAAIFGLEFLKAMESQNPVAEACRRRYDKWTTATT